MSTFRSRNSDKQLQIKELMQKKWNMEKSKTKGNISEQRSKKKF